MSRMRSSKGSRSYQGSRSSQGSRSVKDSKENIEATKRRDELCKMLLAKFQGKYPSIPKPVILNKINNFLDTTPLTAQNLNELEDSILAAVGKCKNKPEIKKEIAKPNDVEDDRISVMSGASDFVTIHKGPKELLNTKTKMAPSETLDYRAEEDEWAAIIKFNNKLYQEEIRQDRLRKTREKRFIMSELNRQMEEKNEIKNANKDEENKYLDYQKSYLKHQQDLANEAVQERKMLITSEKLLRDKQRKEDALRKRMEEVESKEQDKQMMERMKKEQELERMAEIARKNVETETLKKMMKESLKLREEQKGLLVLEKEQDIKRLTRQNEIDELKEREWRENMKRKDERNRLIMENSLKAGGGKTLKEEALLADQKIKEQMSVIEARANAEEELQLLKQENAKQRMKEMLDKQIEEKKQKKKYELQQSQEQAAMWKRDSELNRQQDEINSNKRKEVYKRNQDYLLKQIEAAKKTKGFTAMSKQEYLLNKRLVENMKADKENEASGN